MSRFPWNDKFTVYSKADCKKCEGSGYTFVETGARPCTCAGEALAERILRDCGIPEEFRAATLRNYAPGSKEQRAAKKLAADWATNFRLPRRGDEPERHQLGLYIHGPVGTGKTHLACAAMSFLADKQVWSLYRSAPELLLEIRRTFRDGADTDESDLMDLYCEVPLLVLDDLGSEKFSDFSRQTLHMIFDRRYRFGKPIIVTSNLDIHSLRDNFDERVASRIVQMCQAVFVQGSDYRQVLAEKREAAA